MPCPVGALRKATQPHLIATHLIATHPIAAPHRTTLAAAGPWPQRAFEANNHTPRAQRKSPSFPEPPEPRRLSWIGGAGCSFFRNPCVVRSLRTSIGPRLALALSCERIRHARPSLPSQSSRPSAQRPRSRGARTRDAPFEGLSYTAMRRSFRTHRLGVYYTQGFTLGWYAVPRWGTPESHPTTPHCNTPHRRTPSPHPGGSGTLAAARLGGEHHTHSRAARKPILPRASSARGGQGPAELAPETHPSRACPTQLMRRSFRTHRLGVSRTQGFTLGWYAVPRWGTPENQPTNQPTNQPHTIAPSHHSHSHHPGQSETRASARLGCEHHSDSRAARTPILPRAS
jgi:hypothetical protein